MDTLTLQLPLEHWQWIANTLKNAGHLDYQDLGQELGKVLANYSPDMANSVHSLGVNA